MKRATGFTLLEVLVALAVLAIAMGAVIGATTQSVNTVGVLRDRTFATWVALNKVNELLLAPTAWPEEGSRKGETELREGGTARTELTNEPGPFVRDLVHRLGDDVPGLTVTRPSLEDVYLDLIGVAS